MTDRDRMIDDIILAFDWEMGIVERRTIMAEGFEQVSGPAPWESARQHGKEDGGELDPPPLLSLLLVAGICFPFRVLLLSGLFLPFKDFFHYQGKR